MSRARRLVTGVAALSLFATTGFTALPAMAEESPDAETTSEATDEAEPTAEVADEEVVVDEEAAADPNDHKKPKDDPGELELLIGQSIQVRANADGEQNSPLANFRWAITQISAEGTTGESIDVRLPMAPAPLLRSLNGFGGEFEQDDEGVTFPFEDVDGIQLQRTLNLWPQDGPESELPLSLETEFTLNGEVVPAQDIVGAGGEVTATYRLTNNTTEEKDVTFTNLAGEEVDQTVETDVPYVAISKALIPQNWARFNPGAGLVGADGRGRWQTQWISLPFRPLSQQGAAEFGWTAIIPEGEGFIPSVLIEGAPLFHAESEGAEDTADNNDTSGGLGIGGPDISGDLGVVKAGATQLVLGIGGLADVIGGAVGEVSSGLEAGIPQIADAITELQGILGGSDVSLIDALNEAIDLLNELLSLYDSLPEEVSPGNLDQLVALINENEDVLNSLIINNPTFVTLCAASTELSRDQCALVKDLVTQIVANKDNLQALSNLLRTAEGAITVLRPLTAALEAVRDLLVEISGPLATLASGIGDIGEGVGAALAQLPGASAAVNDIVGGIGQLKVGVGGISAEVRAFLGQLITVAAEAAAKGKDVAVAVNDLANTLKAQLGGMLQRMHESPLPYGGPDNDAGLEYTNNLYGAVQFVLDPANNNAPNTVPRILLALLLLVGAGFAGKALSGRGDSDGGDTDGSADEGDDGGEGDQPDWLASDQETTEVPAADAENKS